MCPAVYDKVDWDFPPPSIQCLFWLIRSNALYNLVSKYTVNNGSFIQYSNIGIHVLNKLPRHRGLYWSGGINPHVLTSILDKDDRLAASAGALLPRKGMSVPSE